MLYQLAKALAVLGLVVSFQLFCDQVASTRQINRLQERMKIEDVKPRGEKRPQEGASRFN